MPKKCFWQNNSFLKWAIFFSCLLLNKDFACAYTGKSTCTRAFTEGFWYFALSYRYIEHVHEEVSCQKNFFWINNCFSNLAILCGLCIWYYFSSLTITVGVSDKHWLLSFFSLQMWYCRNSHTWIRPQFGFWSQCGTCFTHLTPSHRDNNGGRGLRNWQFTV